MEKTFLIVLNMRTADGFSKFGQFDVGMDRKAVEELYGSLEGKEPEGDEGFLHLDLMEIRKGLPVNLRVLSCSAAELSRNVYMITKEIFRWKNLNEVMPE